MSIGEELIASAIHIFDNGFINNLFEDNIESDRFRSLQKAYKKDTNSKEIHVRNANYIIDLMMGGNGDAYKPL